MPRSLLTRVLPGALTLGLAGALWMTLAPPQLGGRTMLATSYGSSMEPLIHRGDVLVLRKGGPARVGDVVGYRSAILGKLVVHRVHRVDRGRLVLKGDNNSFLDPDRVPQSAVVGHLAFHVPRAGVVVEELRRPQAAAGLGVVAALFLAGGSGARRRRRARDEAPVEGRGPSPATLRHERALWGIGALGLLSSIGLMLGWSSSAALVAAGGAGLILAAVLLAVATVVERRTRVPGEAAAIERRLRRGLLTVESIDVSEVVAVVEVASIDALVAIAQEYERLVLHQQRGDAHAYTVLEDGTIYRYELAA
jgi:signal peptidase I